MSYCNNCHNERLIDVRKPYKELHKLGMAKYIPLVIACPTCSKDYKCDKCGSKNIKLIFAKFASENNNFTKIDCKDCNEVITAEIE